MNRKIIVNHKEFKMGKLSADAYMDYLELQRKLKQHRSREQASVI